MMTLTIEHIVSDPHKHGGKPYIAGTGVTVQHIAALSNLGWAVQDLVEEFELTAGQVYAALSYYADHQAVLDQASEHAKRKTQSIGTSIETLQHRIETRQARQ